MNIQPIPALDYEKAKDFFYTKLERDRHGKGRMESAFFHTAQWIFDQGCAGQATLLAMIIEMEAAAAKRDAFIRSLLDPERYGWSVSQEVRTAAREILK